MKLSTMHDLFVAQLRDIYSAEQQITKALPKLARAAASETLAEAFRSHLLETEGQIGRLETIFGILDVTSRGPKCKGMEGLLAEGADMIRAEGADEVIDAGLIADAQRVEHYEISAYGSAKALAALLGYKQIGMLLEETEVQEVATDMKLTAIALNEVNPAALGMHAAA